MRYMDSLDALQYRARLRREAAERSATIIEHLIADGGYERFGRTVLDLYRSLTQSQRQLMLVDL